MFNYTALVRAFRNASSADRAAIQCLVETRQTEGFVAADALTALFKYVDDEVKAGRMAMNTAKTKCCQLRKLVECEIDILVDAAALNYSVKDVYCAIVAAQKESGGGVKKGGRPAKVKEGDKAAASIDMGTIEGLLQAAEALGAALPKVTASMAAADALLAFKAALRVAKAK